MFTPFPLTRSEGEIECQANPTDASSSSSSQIRPITIYVDIVNPLLIHWNMSHKKPTHSSPWLPIPHCQEKANAQAKAKAFASAKAEAEEAAKVRYGRGIHRKWLNDSHQKWAIVWGKQHEHVNDYDYNL